MRCKTPREVATDHLCNKKTRGALAVRRSPIHTCVYMSSLAALALAGAGACARAGGGRALGPRLHVPQPLAAGCGVGLPEAQRHYLFSVMRLREGGRARLFNADDGEFEAVVDAIGKRECRVSLLSRRR